MYMMAPWGNWQIIMFPIFLVVVIIPIAFIIILLFQQNSKEPDKKSSEDAVEIVKKRFAKGEISEEEYKKVHNLIKN